MNNPTLKERVTERFLRYTRFETTSNELSNTAPSTSGQTVFAQALVTELKNLGAQNVRLCAHGIVYASLPASAGLEAFPTLGLIAHMDTSPEASGRNVTPRIIRYNGTLVTLNAEKKIALTTEQFPELAALRGEELIVTDGTTLLGADDKAGVAAIVTLIESLLSEHAPAHPSLSFAFTPDEEIGRGTDHFDLTAFGADYAFTVDGGAVGLLGTNTFNAAQAVIDFNGVSVHPGSAKGKLKSALKSAARFVMELPQGESPETTEGYEGFYHPISLTGGTESAKLTLIIRDHDRESFEKRKAFVRERVRALGAHATLSMRDQYSNMAEGLAKRPDVLDLARAAYRAVGLEPIEPAERGGTDGCKLTQMGLVCPNLFTGGLNYHGIYECLPVASLLKCTEMLIALVKEAGSGSFSNTQQ